MTRTVQAKLAEKWFVLILLAILVAGVILTEVGTDTHHKSQIWSVGSSSKKTSSAPIRATSAPIRATSAPRTTHAPVRTTHAPVRTTHAPVRTTHAPLWATPPTVRTTTHGPIYPHGTTPRPYYPTQPYHPPPPMYPVLPNPPPIYVPPPAPANPTIIFIERETPKPPKTSIIIGTIGSLGSLSSKTTTQKPTTTSTTTTTRRPKTTTEEPWQGIEGGYDRKAWIDFVKSTQRKDIPLSGQWVRIRGGKSMREGYVEILGEGGVWGSVCDGTARWDLHKANIVCRQLGYRGGAEAAWQGRPADNITIVQPSQVREVNCGPTASTLLHCNLRRSKEGYSSEVDVDGTCFGRTRNVGVRCRPEPNTVCQFGEKTFGTSCYRVVSPPSYGRSKEFATLGTEAVQTCRSVPRSHIVSVTTQAENDFLSDWLQSEYPSVDTVLTSGIGTFLNQDGPKKPPKEWWLWAGQYRDVEYERWWPGWTSNPTITPIVPAKSMMCIVMHNRFPQDNKRGPSKPADYFFWKAYTGTTKSKPVPFVCERPADDVGCLILNQEYTGPANVSESGKSCLNWNLQEVRNSPITSHLYLSVPSRINEMVNSGGNACRRVTMDKEPWCFVSPGPGQQPIPEQCLIPICGHPSAITSYYEAPKKTNNYAPNYIQIPASIGLESIPATNQAGLSYSVPLPSQTRTLVIKEEPHSVASAKDVTDFTVRRLDGPVFWKSMDMEETPKSGPNVTFPVIEQHRSLMELVTERVPTTASLPNSEISPKAQSHNIPDLSIQTTVPLTNTRTLILDTLPLKENTSKKEGQDSLLSNDPNPVVATSTFASIVGVITTECELRPNDSNSLRQDETSTKPPCVPKVTYPAVPTPPSLFYPHPENELILTTTAPSTEAPKRSLYGSRDSPRLRYAAGQGHAFHRQLSSSDLVLILNGILPKEQIGAEDVSTTVAPTETKPYSTGDTQTIATSTWSPGTTQITSLHDETEPTTVTENPSTTQQPELVETTIPQTQTDATTTSSTPSH